MSFFNDETIKSLEEPLSKEDVKQRDGTGNTKLSYIASHHAIKEANRIFGFGNWSTEIQHIQMVDKTEYEKKPYNVCDEPKPMISISYTCHIKLTVNSGDKYIYDAVKNGIPETGELFDHLLNEIKAGVRPDLENKIVDDTEEIHLFAIRKQWNKKAPSDIALPTEISD